MTRTHIKTFLLTILVHASVLLFGGLLLFRAPKQASVREDVELISESSDEKNSQKDKDKESKEQKPAEKDQAPESEERIAEEKEPAPDLHDLAALDAPIAGPALAALSLSDLEGALNTGMEQGGEFGGTSSLGSGGRIGASGVGGTVGDMETILSATELDQRPRAIVQPPPSYPSDLRKQRVQGSVQVVFLVDTQGRVLDPKVERSSNSAFEKPAIEAVKQWRFEAGTRNGEKVQFKLRVPITFSAS